MALRHERRLLQKSEINLGREGTTQAANFPELRNEIVALKKLEQEQKEVALRIAQIEEGIKKIEADRQQNTHEQNAAVAKLEAEKKPLLQHRNQAKNTVDLCERELAAVERRIQENDAADRALLKQLSDLRALTPPPADLETQSTNISARRARLPEERAELEARDRTLNESVRVQQEAVREARAHHQTVEERKNPAYLNIGRHLAAQGIAPPNAPHLLTEAHRRHDAVNRHLQHRSELALLSSQIDKQELRKFYFSVISVLVLLAIILPVAFQSPHKREWLPQETDAILSINTDQFERADLAKRWRNGQTEIWPKIWSGLIGAAALTPGLNLPHDAARITRAVTTEQPEKTREFVLIEARRDVSRAIRQIGGDKTF